MGGLPPSPNPQLTAATAPQQWVLIPASHTINFLHANDSATQHHPVNRPRVRVPPSACKTSQINPDRVAAQLSPESIAARMARTNEPLNFLERPIDLPL
jgi:hypothetical protein